VLMSSVIADKNAHPHAGIVERLTRGVHLYTGGYRLIRLC
jgi:hypothetical protein